MKNKYPPMLWGGGLSTLILFLQLFPTIPTWLDIIINIIAMLGSGVFCSALVSILIEKQNKTLEKARKNEQRQYILLSVKDRLKRVYSRELYQLSFYYAKYVLKKETKLLTEELTVEELSKKLNHLIEQIIKLKESESTSADMTVIDADFDNRIKHEYDFLVKRSESFFLSVHHSLLEILDNFTIYYASGIISEDDKNILIGIDSDVDDIIAFSTEQELENGNLLEFKRIFFEKMNHSLSSLGIDSNTTIRCNYIDVF